MDEIEEALIQVAKLMTIHTIKAPPSTHRLRDRRGDETIRKTYDEVERPSSELGEAPSRDSRSLGGSKTLLLMNAGYWRSWGTEWQICVSEGMIMNILGLGIALGPAIETAPPSKYR